MKDKKSVREQVVAEIDPQDFKWEYEAKKASFQTAEAQLQRAKKLLSKQAISKQEYETNRSSYSNGKGCIRICAESAGTNETACSVRWIYPEEYVENYQKVQAGQGIVC